MTQEADSIRRRTLAALAGNRTPGFHFPGYFLEIEWPGVNEREALVSMARGSHCIDTRGTVHPAPLAIVADTALATVARQGIAVGSRLATVNLTLQYSGRPAAGDVAMRARLEGLFEGGSAPHAIARGVLESDGVAVCYAMGTFMLVPPPPGAKLGPLPWQSGASAPPPLAAADLTPHERAVVRAANAALSRSDAQGAFIERFWRLLPRRTARGASCRVKIGPQIGNRVGHVQGGILLGLAQVTASAAVPRHPDISTISAWYIRPGHGEALTARSRIEHTGRSFAVVRTEIRNADRSLVLVAISNHAARGERK